jgi:ABC-type amino acid transport substrate-binding protein
LGLSLPTLLFLLFALVCANVAAQAAPDSEPAAAESFAGGQTTLTIATRDVPPFALREGNGEWRGIAIDLWAEIAERLGLDYRLVEIGLTEMLDAVAHGRVDAAVAALTITSDREKRVDFSHPFHTSGLGIAVQHRSDGDLLRVFQRLFSGRFLAVLGGLLALLTIVGVLIWLAERRANAQFPGNPTRGIGAGLWWSAVTMTTVGYGDKAPTTLAGRAIALVWMFAGLIIISSFTAAITTALTVVELNQTITRVEDLHQARVVTLKGSSSEPFLSSLRVRHRSVSSLPEALSLLAEGSADAVVYDAPILKYLIAEQYVGALRVLPFVLQRQDYGIALPQGSPAREPVNEALLRIIRSDGWSAELERYLGRAG